MPARGEDDVIRYFAAGINLKALAQTLVVPARAGRLFIPTQAFLHLTTVAVYAVTAAILRLGNNGTFDNAAPLIVVPLTLLTDSLLPIPLAALPAAINIGATGISVDVQTAGAATTLTGTVHLMGIVV